MTTIEIPFKGRAIKVPGGWGFELFVAEECYESKIVYPTKDEAKEELHKMARIILKGLGDITKEFGVDMTVIDNKARREGMN